MEWVHRFLDNGDINSSDANADGSPVFTEAELQVLDDGMIDADCTMMLDELVYHTHVFPDWQICRHQHDVPPSDHLRPLFSFCSLRFPRLRPACEEGRLRRRQRPAGLAP